MYSSLQVFKAEFFRALAHPIRIRLLEHLVDDDHSVQELQRLLDVDQPVVSQHLAVLRAKGVVSTRKSGTSVRYAVRDPMIGRLLEIARAIFDHHLVDTQAMLKELRKEAR